MNARLKDVAQPDAGGPRTVYQAIAAVMGELAKRGISKDQTNTFDKYKFRGIDDLYNALGPLLARHGLLILPNVIERDVQERTSQKGGAVFYVTVTVEFNFVSVEDGSTHVVRTYGEAMDRGDKGTNKAITSAFKYACFEAFCIPVEGTDDADSETHEVKARALAPTVPVVPHGTAAGQPGAGIWEGLTEGQRADATKAATIIGEYADTEDYTGAHEYIEGAAWTHEFKIAVWSLLPSKTRTALKKVAAQKNEAAQKKEAA